MKFKLCIFNMPGSILGAPWKPMSPVAPKQNYNLLFQARKLTVLTIVIFFFSICLTITHAFSTKPQNNPFVKMLGSKQNEV